MMSGRKKIAIVTHSYPCFTGDWRANFLEALALAYSEHAEVTVFVPYMRTWRRDHVAESSPVRIICYRYLPFAGWHTFGIEPIMQNDIKLSRRGLLAVPFLVLAGVWQLFRALRHEHYDLVHAHWAVPNAFIALAARWLANARATKVFASFPGSDVTLLSAFGPWRGLAARWLASCDYLSCNSADLRAALVAAGIPERRIELVLYGVDEKRLFFRAAERERIRAELGLGTDTPVLLMVGRFVAKKGFATAFRALPAIVRAVPAAVLLVIGDGQLAGEYQAILAENGCGGQVRFLGRKPLPEVGGYYSACDILLMPSRRLPPDGLNVAVLEAMACGRPIIATAVGGNEMVVEHGINGYVHAEDDAAVLASQAIVLLQDQAQRAAMGDASLRLIRERFNWRAIASQYLAKINQESNDGTFHTA